jgi:uncharacterized membrane protein YdjX (TVP38/TMEM64 family)
MNIKDVLKDKKTYFILIFLAIIIASLGLLLMQILDKTLIPRVVIQYLIVPVAILGVWGIFLYFGVMTIQSLLVPIPSELVLLASGLLWTIVGGTVIGFLGSIFTGFLAYYITLKGGRPLAEKFVPKKFLDPLDMLIKRYGFAFILVMRAIPFMSYDPISYASGLLKINFKKYMIATTIGSFPRALFYAFLGTLLLGQIGGSAGSWTPEQWEAFIGTNGFLTFADTFNTVFYVILGVLVALFILYTFVFAPWLQKKGGTAGSSKTEEVKAKDEPETK